MSMIQRVLTRVRQVSQNVRTDLALRGIDIPFLASSARPSSVASKYQFTEYDLPQGFGFRFIQSPGVSLQQMAKEINAECRRLFGKDAIHPSVLGNNHEMQQRPRERVSHALIIAKDTNAMTRNEQRQHLARKGMSFAVCPVVMIAAGLLRSQKGFPTDTAYHGMGSVHDQGDLFKGGTVRTDGDALTTYAAYGVYVNPYVKDSASLEDLFAAGSPNSKS